MSAEYQVGDLRQSIEHGDWGQPTIVRTYELAEVSEHTWHLDIEKTPTEKSMRVRVWVLVDVEQVQD